LHKEFEIVSHGQRSRTVSFDEEWYTLGISDVQALLAQSRLRLKEAFGTYTGDQLFEHGNLAPSAYKNIYVLELRPVSH
jgi:hypothetical protein